MKFNLALTALCLVSVTGITHADYANPARDLAATCANCHGTDGRSAGGLESLAGEPADKMLEKMAAFSAGERPATIMHQIAKGYTDEQLKMIADYYAAQK